MERCMYANTMVHRVEAAEYTVASYKGDPNAVRVVICEAHIDCVRDGGAHVEQ